MKHSTHINQLLGSLVCKVMFINVYNFGGKL